MEACDLGTITLTRKATPNRSTSMSLPEAVAWFAGEGHSDRPQCVSPMLLASATVLSDRLPDRKRQRLKRFVPALVGTAGDGRDRERSLLAMDWLVRVHTPAWLRLVPSLGLAAASLAEHEPVRSVSDAAELIEAPLVAVRRAALAACASVSWPEPGVSNADVSAAVARALSTQAADAAVAATLDISESFLVVCGRMRLAVEQAVLVAIRARPWRSHPVSLDGHVSTLMAPTAELLEDAVIELFARLVDVTPPSGRGWLSAHPAESARGDGLG